MLIAESTDLAAQGNLRLRVTSPENPTFAGVVLQGLTLPPKPIFAVGICHREIPRERHVVDRANHSGEGYFPPSTVVRSRSQ